MSDEPFVPSAERFRAGLEACGLATDEMTELLARIAQGATTVELARELDAGSLLKLKSASRRDHVLQALRRRCLKPPPPLPAPEQLARFLAKVPRPIPRSQALMPYLFANDRGTYDLATEFVLPRLRPGGPLPKAEAIAALAALFPRYGRKAWTPHLQRTWIEGFLSVLRDVGALGLGAKREELLLYAVRPEPFSFHLWGLWDSGLRGAALLESNYWQLLLLKPGDVRPVLDLAVRHGWWKVSLVGSVLEIHPTNPSLSEWIEHGLG